MKTLFLLITVLISAPVLAQQSLRYTVWADGVLNIQLPQSNLYGFGAGLRAEVSKSLRSTRNVLFAQAGYTRHFPQNAFSANTGLVNVGYRYQSRKAFSASIGAGLQYWNERMRVRFPDYTVDETFNSVMPSTTVGFSWRINAHYWVGWENRVLFKPEADQLIIRDNVALSIGYTL